MIENDLVEARQSDRSIGSQDFNRLEADYFCDVSKLFHFKFANLLHIGNILSRVTGG